MRSAPEQAPSWKQRQRAEREALILQHAQELLVEKGYHRTSLDEIAARVGVSKGTIYLHFTSKDALVEALLAQQINLFLVAVQQIADEPVSVRARLERILVWTYRQLQEKRGQFLLEIASRFGLTHQILEQRADLRLRAEQALNRLAALLDEGKRDGEIANDVPTTILVATLQSLLAPERYLQLLAAGQVTPEALAAYVVRLLVGEGSASAATDG
ncbi:MAG: TetR/AcrR family transcriptional regulator [Chloroflexus sp.]|nr:TetR/AcrR family transcriptional regulator [Chloroflexus sp.]